LRELGFRTQSQKWTATHVSYDRLAGQPEQVNVHDFLDKDLGKAIPYGIYDVSANTGWVQRRNRPRHLRIRGRDPAPLVGHHRAASLPERRSAANLRRRRRIQRLPGPRLEEGLQRLRLHVVSLSDPLEPAQYLLERVLPLLAGLSSERGTD